jgi:hypothetical protein
MIVSYRWKFTEKGIRTIYQRHPQTRRNTTKSENPHTHLFRLWPAILPTSSRTHFHFPRPTSATPAATLATFADHAHPLPLAARTLPPPVSGRYPAPVPGILRRSSCQCIRLSRLQFFVLASRPGPLRGMRPSAKQPLITGPAIQALDLDFEFGKDVMVPLEVGCAVPESRAKVEFA